MARDSSGTYTKTFTAVTLTEIESAPFNAQLDDLATEMTASLSRSSGTGAMSRNLPMGGNRVVDVGEATDRLDAPRAEQVLNNAFSSAVDTGAADAYVITLAPVPDSYSTFMELWFSTSNTNTGASTINVNGLGVKNIKLDSATDVGAGAISTTKPNHIVYDGTQFILQVTSGISSGETDASGFGFVIDEDDMASDSDTKVPTQQSTKAYVDNQVLARTAASWARIEWDRTGVQSVPNNTLTTLEYDGTSSKAGAVDFTAGAPTNGFKIPSGSGVTRVLVRLRGLWDIDSTGQRQIHVVRTSPSAQTYLSAFHNTPSNTSGTPVEVDEIITVAEGDEFVFQGFQDTGTALNYGTTSSTAVCYVEVIDYTTGATPLTPPEFTETNKGTYATSTVYTQAHGLGAYPEAVQTWLECTVTDNGYAVGDRVQIDSFSRGENRQIITQVDATNVRVITGSLTIAIPPKTGGAHSVLTTASWDVVVRIR